MRGKWAIVARFSLVSTLESAKLRKKWATRSPFCGKGLSECLTWSESITQAWGARAGKVEVVERKLNRYFKLVGMGSDPLDLIGTIWLPCSKVADAAIGLAVKAA
jgi:hypothetical protein